MAGMTCRYGGSSLGSIVGDTRKQESISAEWAADALLLDVVSRIVRAEYTGARVMQLHGNNVRVVDFREWKSEHTALLTLLRPRVRVSTAGCIDSGFGFEVRIYEAPDVLSLWPRQVAVGVTALLTVATCVWFGANTK